MNADDYKKVKDIFQAAVELPPDERAAYLDERCPDDPDIRAEIDRLLNSYESGFLEDPAVGVLSAALDSGLQSGAAIGHYRILSKIGSGGMGEVYLAEDGKLGRRVAIKLLPETLTEDEDRLRRFEQEARTASALNHPNILTVFEIGDIGETLYIATEYIDGETLRARLNRGRLSVSESLEIAIQCASALVAAHEEGIIHRDIKPENIMLRRDGLVKVLDFGLAKLSQPAAKPAGPDMVHDATTERHVHTAPGVIMGTVEYMSPEQTRGHATDGRTDIWSLGVVLYEMVAGTRPFSGETTADVIAEIVKTDPNPVSQTAEDVPERFDEIVAKSLEKNSDTRYGLVKGMLDDLQSLNRRLNFELEFARLDTAISSIERPSIKDNSTTDGSVHRFTTVSGRRFSLIGREAEVALMKDLLRADDVHLVTLTGVGGTGKTTLAKTVAGEMLRDFEGRVCFVELASVTDPKLVAPTIAQALALKEAGSKPILDILKEYLRANPSLLVVDNFEQVASAAPLLTDLIEHATASKIIVTSRVLLRLSREVELRVSTLDVPQASLDIKVEDLAKNDSVRLFVRSAQVADPAFRLNNDNASAVAEICRSLDGLPLAIELAAARVRIISPKAILERLESRLDLLTGGAKDLPARQQTVRATIEWSYDLLKEDEQTIFRRLAVFAGGFTIAAAESVVGQIDDDTLNGVTSLYNASLIVKATGINNEPRFRMLEVVREYALERFEASGETDAVRRRHAAFFRAMGEKAEEHLRSAQSSEWFDLLESENDNLRAVLTWSLENDGDTATHLTAKIPMFWIQRGYLTEGQRWLQAALGVEIPDPSPPLRCRQLMGLGVLSKFKGDLVLAENLFQEALDIGIAVNDQAQVAWSKRQLGGVAYLTRDFESSARYLEESLEISRHLDDKPDTAFTLAALGNLVLAKGHFELARRHLEESLQILRTTGNKAWISLVCWDLGALAFRESDFATAQYHFTESMQKALELGYKSSISHAIDGFAALALKRMDFERSARLASAADRLRVSIGFEMAGDDRGFLDMYISELQSALSENDFTNWWEQGSKLKLHEAVELALHSNRSASHDER